MGFLTILSLRISRIHLILSKILVMKKVVLIITLVFFVLMVGLISIPLLFKQSLLEKTKTSINKNINAKVEFEEFHLSLFKNFPKLTLGFGNVSVVGKEEFQSDTLLSIKNASAQTGLAALFKKSGINIEQIVLEQPILNFIAGKSGNVNWDLEVKPETGAQIPSQPASGEIVEPFTLQLDKVEIKDAIIIYDDREINMYQVFDKVNLGVKGKMFGSSTELTVEGKAGSYSLIYDSVKYISNITLETKSLLKVDYDKMDISIAENELFVNRLPMEVTGLIQMPSDSMFFDLTVKTKDSGFENFLALVPPDYEEYLKKVKTTGTATVSGTIKGLYYKEIYPAIDFKVNVANGNFKYQDLPEEIKNIRADISLSKPEGVLDLTVVNIKNARAEIKNNPVDLTLLLKNLVSDPYFDGAFVGKINFGQLKNALPMDSVNISGTIDANLFVKGNYSDIEKEQYDKIKSDGIVLLDNFLYDSPGFTQVISIPSGKLDFSPQYVNLSQLNMKVGQSDFNLTGKINNYLNYLLKDGVLQGDLQLVSSFVNLNELLRLQKKGNAGENAKTKPAVAAASQDSPAGTEKLVFDIPKTIDITFRSKIDKAVFDKLPISAIQGLITARNGKLILNGLNMNMVDGELILTGSYENTVKNNPLFDFNFEVVKFDIPLAYQSLTGFQKILPVGAQSQGKLSATMKMKGQLSESFQIIPSSVNGTGLLNTENLKIIDSPVFNQLKGILLPGMLKNVDIEDINASFNVENGNINLKPFRTKISGQETTIAGTLNVENLISMRMDFNINRDAFGADIQNILGALPGNKRITVVPAGVTINGPVKKPEVKVDLTETRKIITQAAKEGLNESLDKLGKGLKKLLEK